MNINGDTNTATIKCDTCQEPATHFLWSQTDWELSAYDNPDVTVNSAEGSADKQRFCKECATEQGYLDEEPTDAQSIAAVMNVNGVS